VSQAPKSICTQSGEEVSNCASRETSTEAPPRKADSEDDTGTEDETELSRRTSSAGESMDMVSAAGRETCSECLRRKCATVEADAGCETGVGDSEANHD
jgi:hypothetical protein